MTDDTVREAAASVRVWPVSGEAQAAYSVDALQYNATTQDWRTHAGVDLTAAVGTPVRAAGSGVVTAVYDDEYLGTTVIVNHPDGHVSQYSNLAVMPSVSAGDSVEAGADHRRRRRHRPAGDRGRAASALRRLRQRRHHRPRGIYPMTAKKHAAAAAAACFCFRLNGPDGRQVIGRGLVDRSS